MKRNRYSLVLSIWNTSLLFGSCKISKPSSISHCDGSSFASKYWGSCSSTELKIARTWLQGWWTRFVNGIPLVQEPAFRKSLDAISTQITLKLVWILVTAPWPSHRWLYCSSLAEKRVSTRTTLGAASTYN